MLYKLLVPSHILEDIKHDGIMEAKKDNETTGILIGLVADDAATYLKRYPLFPKKGDDSTEDKRMMKKYIPKIMNISQSIFLETKSLARQGKKPSLSFYHSHPSGAGWSKNDLDAFKDEDDEMEKYGVEISLTSWILYLVGKDNFLALNHELKSIPIIRV